MPPKLPRVSAEDAIRALEHLGFVRIRQRGSHVIYMCSFFLYIRCYSFAPLVTIAFFLPTV